MKINIAMELVLKNNYKNKKARGNSFDCLQTIKYKRRK